MYFNPVKLYILNHAKSEKEMNVLCRISVKNFSAFGKTMCENVVTTLFNLFLTLLYFFEHLQARTSE